MSVDRHIFRECITLYRPPLLVGASAVTLLVLLVAAVGRSDSWPYTTAPVPFTLKIQETDYERNFAGDLAKVETQAQRSDGATVVVVTTYRTPVPSTFRAIRLPDGTRLRLVDAISAKSTCRPKHREVAPVRDTLSIARRPPDCLGPLDKLLGRTTLFGQLVDVVKTWDRGSGGEEWLAPALGCKEFQWQNATMQSDGSRRIDLGSKATQFHAGRTRCTTLRLGCPLYRDQALRVAAARVEGGGCTLESRTCEGERTRGRALRRGLPDAWTFTTMKWVKPTSDQVIESRHRSSSRFGDISVDFRGVLTVVRTSDR